MDERMAETDLQARLEEQQKGLLEARAEADFLAKQALQPDLPLNRKVVYRNLERSARAEAVVRQKAIDWLKEQGATPQQAQNPDQGSPLLPAS